MIEGGIPSNELFAAHRREQERMYMGMTPIEHQLRNDILRLEERIERLEKLHQITITKAIAYGPAKLEGYSAARELATKIERGTPVYCRYHTNGLVHYLVWTVGTEPDQEIQCQVHKEAMEGFNEFWLG